MSDPSSPPDPTAAQERLDRLARVVDLLRDEGVEVGTLRRALREGQHPRGGPTSRELRPSLARSQELVQRATLALLTAWAEDGRSKMADLPEEDPRRKGALQAMERSRASYSAGDLLGALRFGRIARELLEAEGAPP